MNTEQKFDPVLALACAAWCRQAYAAPADRPWFITEHDDCIVVAFAGTRNIQEYLTDLRCMVVPTPVGGVHAGFWWDFQMLRDQVIADLAPYAANPKPLLLTGHSLGGSRAVLLAAHLSSISHLPSPTIYTFGQPRTFNRSAALRYDAACGPRTFRVVKQYDPIPHSPPPGIFLRYRHCGNEIYLPDNGAPVVNRSFGRVLLGDAIAMGKAWVEISHANLWLGDDIAVEHGISEYVDALSNLDEA